MQRISSTRQSRFKAQAVPRPAAAAVCLLPFVTDDMSHVCVPQDQVSRPHRGADSARQLPQQYHSSHQQGRHDWVPHHIQRNQQAARGGNAVSGRNKAASLVPRRRNRKAANGGGLLG
jgi:hypothetical protein